MHCYYSDILKAVPKEPIWFDENAVPRFCEFSTESVANIYAQEIALALIECQNCSKKFKVGFSELNLKRQLWDFKKEKKVKLIRDLISDQSLHYGDPPNIRCCNAGPSMTSVTLEILEYWYKPTILGEGLDESGTRVIDCSAMKLRRDKKFEIAFK